MNIKILTPEYVVFEGEVDSILLPGKSGEFQMFKNHAAVVSALVSGDVKLFTEQINAPYSKNFTQDNDGKPVFSFPIKSGVLEFSNDKGIILCE